MKFWTRITLLAIIDFVIIWFWVKQMNPDPSVSIGMLFLIPFVVIVNLITALILYFTKRELASLFVINSAIAGILMFYLFEKGIDRYQNERLESWEFKIQDTTYKIIHWKLEKTFSMSESNKPGSSTGFLDGKLTKLGNEHYLRTDSTEYIIKDGYFYKFRNVKDKIKLTKIER